MRIALDGSRHISTPALDDRYLVKFRPQISSTPAPGFGSSSATSTFPLARPSTW